MHVHELQWRDGAGDHGMHVLRLVHPLAKVAQVLRHVVGPRRDIDHVARGGADEVSPDDSICDNGLRRGTLASLVSATRRIRRRSLHRKPHRLADHHRRLANATFRGLANLGDYVVRVMFRQNKGVRVA